MVSRGIRQLQRINVFYCDIGGSSKTLREVLKSERLFNYVKDLPSVKFEFFIKRNIHPRLVAEYANGYSKTVCIRKYTEDEIFRQLFYYKNEGGHSPYKHGGNGVITFKPSIQGPYKNNLWQTYPQHKMEEIKLPPGPIRPELNTEPKRKPRRTKSALLHYSKMKVQANYNLPIRSTGKL